MKKEDILNKLRILRRLVIQIKEDFKEAMADVNQDSKYTEAFDKKLEEMIEKIDRGIENISKEKVSMALFGAFSDGKSSVVSAITKNFNIKIAPEPTTDKVTFYEYGNFFIVDTPGTFSHSYLHDETTRKYISEANVILFVVDAVNPIKDSHKDLVKEVLIDMKKLENTIFILNKMDNVVVDLEDEEEYNQMTQIKKKALLDTLDYLKLSEEDRKKIRIVAVSSNPNNLGFDYWSKKWDECMKLSRIGNLIKEIEDVYQKDRERIIYDSGVSVILDVVNELEKTINPEDFKVIADQLNELEESVKGSYHKMESWINQAFTLYRNRIGRVKQDYLNRLDLCRNLTELSDFVKTYISYDKNDEKLEKMQDKIKSETEDIIQVAIEAVEEFDRSIQTKAILLVGSEDFEEKSKDLNIPSINPWEESLDDLSGAILPVSKTFLLTGSHILSYSKLQIMHGLLHFRRVSGLSHFIKFTGRGTHMIWASKWASVVQGFGALMNILGIVGFILGEVMRILEKEKFNNAKSELRNFIENLFSYIDSSEFFFDLAGINILELQKHFEAYINQIEHQKNNYQRYYESLNQTFKSLRHLRDYV